MSLEMCVSSVASISAETAERTAVKSPFLLRLLSSYASFHDDVCLGLEMGEVLWCLYPSDSQFDCVHAARMRAEAESVKNVFIRRSVVERLFLPRVYQSFLLPSRDL